MSDLRTDLNLAIGDLREAWAMWAVSQHCFWASEELEPIVGAAFTALRHHEQQAIMAQQLLTLQNNSTTSSSHLTIS